MSEDPYADHRPELLVPAGKLFCFTEGEYSDFGIKGTFLALEDITKTKLHVLKESQIKIYRTEALIHQKEMDEYEIGQELGDRFLGALVKKGWIMDIDLIQLHYGSYGRFELL